MPCRFDLFRFSLLIYRRRRHFDATNAACRFRCRHFAAAFRAARSAISATLRAGQRIKGAARIAAYAMLCAEMRRRYAAGAPGCYAPILRRFYR